MNERKYLFMGLGVAICLTVLGAMVEQFVGATSHELAACAETCHGRVAEFNHSPDGVSCICEGPEFEDRE